MALKVHSRGPLSSSPVPLQSLALSRDPACKRWTALVEIGRLRPVNTGRFHSRTEGLNGSDNAIEATAITVPPAELPLEINECFENQVGGLLQRRNATLDVSQHAAETSDFIGGERTFFDQASIVALHKSDKPLQQ